MLAKVVWHSQETKKDMSQIWTQFLKFGLFGTYSSSSILLFCWAFKSSSTFMDLESQAYTQAQDYFIFPWVGVFKFLHYALNYTFTCILISRNLSNVFANSIGSKHHGKAKDGNFWSEHHKCILFYYNSFPFCLGFTTLSFL